MKRGTESEAPNIDRLWAVGLILILGFAVVWRWIASGAPSGGDGAQYLAHALALAEGRPYDEIGYLYTPAMWSVGPPRYPPGLPATLAPLLALFGPFSQATLVLMHLFLFAFVCLAGAYFARESGSMVGWGVAGMVATALLLGDQADIVGSDLGFCALVWGVLLLADHPRRLSWKHSGLLTLLGSAALAYRLAAAPLLPAAGAFAILKRKQMGWAMLLPAVVWLGILLLIFQYFGPGEAPSADVAGSGSGGTARNLFPSLEGWIGAVDRRLSVYQNALSEAYLYPLPWKTANQAYQLGAFGVTLVGLWPWIRQAGTHIRGALRGDHDLDAGPLTGLAGALSLGADPLPVLRVATRYRRHRGLGRGYCVEATRAAAPSVGREVQPGGRFSGCSLGYDPAASVAPARVGDLARRECGPGRA